MHAEVAAYLQIERLVERRQRLAHAAAWVGGLGMGWVLKGFARGLLVGRIEPHWGGAVEVLAWAAPVVAALALVRAYHARWRATGGRRLVAEVASRHRVSPASLGNALGAELAGPDSATGEPIR